MRTTVPCPNCKCSLTFIATEPTLACPFCSATIKFARGKYPAGEKVRCSQCQKTFAAEPPAPEFRVYASTLEPCPACHVKLAIRHDLPPGKPVRCSHCQTKFLPKRDGASPVTPAAVPHLPEETDDASSASVPTPAPDETASAAPAKTPKADDEIVFFDHEKRIDHGAVEKAAPPANGHAGQAPVDLPDTIRVSVSRQNLLGLNKIAVEAVPAKQKHRLHAPKPAHRQSGPVKPAGGQKSGADREPTAAEGNPDPGRPTPEAPVADDSLDALAPPAPDQAPTSSGPLSMRSVVELDAAALLLDDSGEPDVVLVPDEEPTLLKEEAERSPARRPAYTPPMPRRPAKPADADADGAEIDRRKMLTYAGLAAALLLGAVGIYYLYFAD